ncbi:MAG: hypothetical protein L0K67_08815, partial [Brevibacterium sp.]|nr:hypothetical protein [Brevibacterium sp.]
IYSLTAGTLAFIGINGLGFNAGTVVFGAVLVGLLVAVVLARRSPGKPLVSSGGDGTPERAARA